MFLEWGRWEAWGSCSRSDCRVGVQAKQRTCRDSIEKTTLSVDRCLGALGDAGLSKHRECSGQMTVCEENSYFLYICTPSLAFEDCFTACDKWSSWPKCEPGNVTKTRSRECRLSRSWARECGTSFDPGDLSQEASCLYTLKVAPLIPRAWNSTLPARYPAIYSIFKNNKYRVTK